ncbi:phosphoribosyltransferase-like protein [Flagelloscypha sp. PMI_526]|nr:phosphoribosyltransferase-like protein [Flagelloscypha sp. PMI_526]
MCGILGLLLDDQGLSLLQHRGQDACGIVTCGPKGRFFQCKANGMVRDVFDPSSIDKLVGWMGVGHVRYPTAGSFNNAEAQPFYVNSPYGIVFAHFRINEEDIFNAIKGMMQQVKGAYACVAMLAGFGIIAFRDPNGIRPIGMAHRKSTTTNGQDYLFASESVVADASGFSEWQDVRPGEAIIATRTGVSRRQCSKPATFAPDIFEYVYFSRPDSVLDGISVYRSRMAMGDILADEVKRVLEEKNMTVDVVIPVPDTSRVAALNLAQKLQLPYREGFIKNRYVGRTFIMPGQQMRKRNVRRKLNAMALEFAGKNVLLVDDSIVRGTTSKEIVQMAKDVGAKKVLVASCAPPIRYSNVYGIDMPSRSELVAHNRTTEEIATEIGADLVIFQTLDDLITSVRGLNKTIEQFDCSVFTGKYVTGGVDEAYLQNLEGLRADNTRGKLRGGLEHMEGKGGGGVVPNGVNGHTMHSGGHQPKRVNSMSSNDETVGLHNTFRT